MKYESIFVTNFQLCKEGKGTTKIFGMQVWQQSDNYEQKMNIQIQTISRKEF